MRRLLISLLLALPAVLRAQQPAPPTEPPQHVLLLPPARVSVDPAIQPEVDDLLAITRPGLVELKTLSLHARDSMLAAPPAAGARQRDTADLEASLAQFPADPSTVDFGAVLLQREHALARHLARKRHNRSRVYAAFDRDPSDSAGIADMVRRLDASIVIAIPSVELKRILMKTSLVVHYQFFRTGEPAPFLDSTIVVGAENNGGLTTCNDGTIDCAINNATGTIAMQLAYGLLTGDWDTLTRQPGERRRDDE